MQARYSAETQQAALKSVFEQICHLARIEDAEGLRKYLAAEGASLLLREDGRTPVWLLAKEGNEKAVNFLLKKFYADINHAAAGYAEAGLIPQMEALLSRGAELKHAVLGAARAGLDDLVEALLNRKASIDAAVYGYALAGLHDQVKAFLQHGADKNHAVLGYAEAGLHDHVEALLAQGADINYGVLGVARAGLHDRVEALLLRGADKNCAIDGYAYAGLVSEVEALLKQNADIQKAILGFNYGGWLIDENTLLRLLSLVEDEKIRRQIVVYAIDIIHYDSDSLVWDMSKKMLAKAKIIRRDMEKYGLSYSLLRKAQQVLQPDMKTWLLQGQQILPAEELVIHIASYLMGLPRRETMKLSGVMQQRVFEGASDSLLSKFNMGMFSRQEYDLAQKKLVGMYQPQAAACKPQQ